MNNKQQLQKKIDDLSDLINQELERSLKNREYVLKTTGRVVNISRKYIYDLQEELLILRKKLYLIDNIR